MNATSKKFVGSNGLLTINILHQVVMTTSLWSGPKGIMQDQLNLSTNLHRIKLLLKLLLGVLIKVDYLPQEVEPQIDASSFGTPRQELK